LLLEPFLQSLHDRVPGAQGLDLLHLLGREVKLRDLPQPLLRDRDGLGAVARLDAFEDLAEHLVEAVEQPLVLHERGPRQIIEFLRPCRDHLRVERLEQDRCSFIDAGIPAARSSFMKEKNIPSLTSVPPRLSKGFLVVGSAPRLREIGTSGG
jgi:hypothetical protein